jgi:membrane-anchored glycerophosphoryl diester phosphodiesterase (GDPDase)
MRYKSGVKGPSPGAERWLSVNLRRIVGFLLVAFLIFFILTQPVAAAGLVSSILATLRVWATNFGTFISTSVSRL